MCVRPTKGDADSRNKDETREDWGEENLARRLSFLWKKSHFLKRLLSSNC